MIEHLWVKDFRLFTETEIQFAPGVNLIKGDNGTGKTTILEAIYLAGRGKSFRHHHSKPLIREGAESLNVVLRTAKPQGVIGVELSQGKTAIRVDRKELERRSELLRRLPIQLLTPQSHRLIESGPKARRVFLDLGLFHVEPTYHGLLSDFDRVLRQRNAALRTGWGDDFRAFDPQLASYGERLADRRLNYAQQLENQSARILGDLLPDIDFQLRARRGWSGERTYSEALKAAHTADRRAGYTTVGPQRGGMEIKTAIGPAEKVLSRGQQKLLVAGLVLSQVVLIASKTTRWPLLLLDDLSAELDRTNRTRLLALLASFPAQAVVTNTEWEDEWRPYLAQVFHVEH